MMEKIRLNLVKKVDDSYDIIIGKHLFSEIADGLSKLKIGNIGIITDSNVKQLYGNKFISILKEKSLDTMMISFTAGEQNKIRLNKEKIEDVLISAGMGRDSVIIALGGGVVGDLAGFVASTFMRGISYLQVPTTLLAMVDSSIGGKTGLDTPYGKNLIGSFYQPKRVFIDISVLKTLSKQEMLNGIAEMIKHAIILDKKFFAFMEDNLDSIFSLDDRIVTKAIKWSCMLKKNIVERDERESSLRKILNFGHTIGHAIEKSTKYRIKHGEAIVLGMKVETRIAEELGLINPVDSKKIFDLIHKAGFETTLSHFDIRKIIENTRYDKKKAGGRVRYVLPKKVGKVKIDVEVSEEVIVKVLGEMK